LVQVSAVLLRRSKKDAQAGETGLKGVFLSWLFYRWPVQFNETAIPSAASRQSLRAFRRPQDFHSHKALTSDAQLFPDARESARLVHCLRQSDFPDGFRLQTFGAQFNTNNGPKYSFFSDIQAVREFFKRGFQPVLLARDRFLQEISLKESEVKYG
jgi:hypothetical protein